MTRSKWISFGAQQSLERAAKAAAATAIPVSRPLQSPADAKKFGLENVRLSFLMCSITCRR